MCLFYIPLESNLHRNRILVCSLLYSLYLELWEFNKYLQNEWIRHHTLECLLVCVRTVCAHPKWLLRHLMKVGVWGVSFCFSSIWMKYCCCVGCQTLMIKANSVIWVKYYLRCFVFSFPWLLIEGTLYETIQKLCFYGKRVGFYPQEPCSSSLRPQNLRGH